MRKLKIIFCMVLLLLIIIIMGCKTDNEYFQTDIELFKNTEVWELAKAVKYENVSKIKRIGKLNPEILNCKESKFGYTLLHWSVGMEKYKSTKALLESGANPNIVSKQYKTYDEQTPLSIAASYSWIDVSAKKDPKFVKLLLKYGADPNWTYSGRQSGTKAGTSILMNSIGTGLEKTKALVDRGADVNYKTSFGDTVAIVALLNGCGNRDVESRRYAHYLIVEKNAIVNEPYIVKDTIDGVEKKIEFFPVDLLRSWVCDLKSEDYKLKMDIVEEFKRQGVDYWNTEVPNSVLETIKRRYPNDWEDFIRKY